MSAEPAICDLKYFAGKANELTLLRDRVAELEEVLGIREGWTEKITRLGFTRGEATCLGILMKRSLVSRESIWTIMYGSSADHHQPGDRLVDVWIMKCRRKLKHFDVDIKTVWGQGWLISEHDKALLLSHMEGTAS